MGNRLDGLPRKVVERARARLPAPARAARRRALPRVRGARGRLWRGRGVSSARDRGELGRG